MRIGCGEAKRGWLTSAAIAFGKTAPGRDTRIDLVPENAEGLTVLATARSMDKTAATFAPFLPGETSIALSPLVFVVWSNRLAAFQSKYGDPSLESFAHALSEPRGWEAAGHPEWGFFRFGVEDHVAAMTLLAYDVQGKTTGLTPHDVLALAAKPSFQSFAHNATSMSMREFAARGPDAYDAALVYESSALEFLEAAQKRWGEVRIVYPQRNLWSDNPYYIVDAPWTTKEQREAAQAFLGFLVTETSQKEAIAHGFRPSDPHVPTNMAGSPFVLYQRNGVRENVGQICTPPPPAVMSNLLAAWQRAR